MGWQQLGGEAVAGPSALALSWMIPVLTQWDLTVRALTLCWRYWKKRQKRKISPKRPRLHILKNLQAKLLNSKNQHVYQTGQRAKESEPRCVLSHSKCGRRGNRCCYIFIIHRNTKIWAQNLPHQKFMYAVLQQCNLPYRECFGKTQWVGRTTCI